MREYLDKRKFYLAWILASEAPPFEMVCSSCESSGEWWCLDCLRHPLFCQDCCQHAHWNNPFHKIQQWEKEYFKDSTLLQAGLTLHFGHGGKPCPLIPSDDFHHDEGEDEQMFGLPDLPPELLEDEDDAEFGSIPFTQMELDDDGSLLERVVRDKSTHPKNVLVIVHSNGIHHLPVHWCRCPGHIPDNIQALNLQFFPASFKQVKTLFTFEGLDSFLAENQECKSSAWHYYQKLRIFTSACYPETIPVSN
jgi:CxC2 like cysteine cluster associated with KDZ transposases